MVVDGAAFRYLASIVEYSDDAIISKSLDGTIISWNLDAQALYGYTSAEMMGRSISVLVPPDRADETSMLIERIKTGEHVNNFETRRVKKGGALMDVSITLSPVLDGRGEIVGASSVGRDISRRKQMEAALRDFAGIVAHDLKGPMTSVIGLSQTMIRLWEQLTKEEALHLAARVAANVSHLAELVDGILGVALTDSEKQLFATAGLDLPAIIHSVVDVIARADPAHVCTVDVASDLPKARGDARVGAYRAGQTRKPAYVEFRDRDR